MSTTSTIDSFLSNFAIRYRRCIEQPILIITIVALLCLLAGLQMRDFRFDASSDSLIAEGDPAFEFFEEVSARFAQNPVLVMTYRPANGDLFSRDGVAALASLITQLESVDGVGKVQSLLDAPLLQSPPVPLAELAEGFRTLRSPDVDFALAREELLNSPVFRELLISRDGDLAAIIIDLENSDEVSTLSETVDELRGAEDVAPQQLEQAEQALAAAKNRARAATAEAIADIRSVREEISTGAQMFLGGVPLVASDMVTYIRNDMALFGLAVVALIAVALFGFFRELRWVFVPLGTSAVTVWLTMGVIAAVGEPITAVSSNFVALLTITTVSFSVHLIASYRENSEKSLEQAPCTLAFETMGDKLAPCLYTALTTMVAFASLLVSDIVPIRTFGWMMCVGIVISLCVTYSFFASVLVLLPQLKRSSATEDAPRLTQWFAALATRHSALVIASGLALALIAGLGVSQLSLGNRLVEYFRGDTEIRRGLEVIDRELGGTIPLEVIVQFDPFVPEASSAGDNGDPFGDPFSDPFADPLDAGDASATDSYPERFWFTPAKLRVVERLQKFMDEQSAIGKTLSVSNFERVARGFNDGEPLSYLALTGVLGALPEDVRSGFIDPLASPTDGQLRISARLRETGADYDLRSLIARIEAYSEEELALESGEVRVTGIGVLFNNMLELFFASQFETLGFVLLATLIMFTLLLRSFQLAILGLLPNVLAAMLILGFMGLFGIPLDIMTITIAAIVIGIGVDDAIHYLHRFRQQLRTDCSIKQAVIMSHRTTGQALYFTSFTVVVGFSVLLLSRFVPTAYFGALAALAMLLALAANLLLLPALLIRFYKVKRISV